MKRNITKDFIDFADRNPTANHVIQELTKRDGDNLITVLDEGDDWSLEPGKLYAVKRNGTSAIIFRAPEERISGFHICASHSDSPGLKVKGLDAEMIESGAYIKLNVETYGGLLMSPWFDRPLSLAGRVMIKRNGAVESKLINIDRDLLLIPSVAIHMNKDANKGIEYNPQIDLLPLLGLTDADDGKTVFSGGADNKEYITMQTSAADWKAEKAEKIENAEKTPKKRGRKPKAEKREAGKDLLIRLIADAADVKPEDLVSCDIFVYDRTPGRIWGANDEFFSCKHIDDLQCAFISRQALMDAAPTRSDNGQGVAVPVVAIFDNEEVGSLSKQGADSTFLYDTLQRITEVCGRGQRDYRGLIANSFMISADNAHALHPNHPELHDPKNRPIMNRGIVIKHAANQKYTTDAVSAALFKEICDSAKVPYQEFYNRSDKVGGGTLGNISNAHVSLNTVDIGLPQLAMHSPYETAGVADSEYLYKALKVFFESSLRRQGDRYWFE